MSTSEKQDKSEDYMSSLEKMMTLMMNMHRESMDAQREFMDAQREAMDTQREFRDAQKEYVEKIHAKIEEVVARRNSRRAKREVEKKASIIIQTCWRRYKIRKTQSAIDDFQENQEQEEVAWIEGPPIFDDYNDEGLLMVGFEDILEGKDAFEGRGNVGIDQIMIHSQPSSTMSKEASPLGSNNSMSVLGSLVSKNVFWTDSTLFRIFAITFDTNIGLIRFLRPLKAKRHIYNFQEDTVVQFYPNRGRKPREVRTRDWRRRMIMINPNSSRRSVDLIIKQPIKEEFKYNEEKIACIPSNIKQGIG